ncbi:MAG: hypothetical protein R3282_10700 [Rhodothermales bacterium]|nr:hypothetical protein [Rhodothermales bacterium]
MPPIRSSLGTATLVALLAGSSGCWNQPTSQPPLETDAREIRTFETLRTMDFKSVHQAFAMLGNSSYTARVEVEERDRNADVVARSVGVFDVPRSGTIVPTEDLPGSGEFSEGFLSFLLGSREQDRLGRLSEQLLSTSPPFADLKLREQFSYASPRDTTIHGAEASLHVARAVVPSSVQPVRQARIAATRSDSAIVYVRIDRHDDSIFYEELSTLEITLVESESGLLPVTKRFDVSVDVPFEPLRQFTMIESFQLRSHEASGG